MAERTVVGHEQQALGVLVEPSDCEQAAPQAPGNSSSTVPCRSSRLAVMTPAGLLSI